MDSQKKIFFIAVIIVVVSTGCVKKQARVASVEGIRNARAILMERILKEADYNISSVKGMARALLVSKDGERQTDVAIVVMRPDKIRIDAMDNIADVWAAAGTDGLRLWLWLPQKRKLYRGNVNSRNLRRLSDFDWELSDITSIISGLVPDAAKAELVEIDRHRRHYKLNYKPLHIFMDEKKRPIKLVCYEIQSGNAANEGAEKVKYEVSFSMWKIFEGIEFPSRIEVSFPATSSHLMVEYKEIRFNTQIDSSLFKPETIWRTARTIEVE